MEEEWRVSGGRAQKTAIGSTPIDGLERQDIYRKKTLFVLVANVLSGVSTCAVVPKSVWLAEGGQFNTCALSHMPR
ncbi:MAG: hypothetical protein ACKO96_49550 [Flammeovirgaceae bacterium]